MHEPSETTAPLRLTPAVSAAGHLTIEPDADAPELAPEVAARIRAAFADGCGGGLLHLAAVEAGTALPAGFAWLRCIGTHYLETLRATPGIEEDPARPIAPPSDEFMGELIAAVPPIPGAENLVAGTVGEFHRLVDAAFRAGRAASGLPLAEYLHRLNPAWNLVGRVHLNLAENRRDESHPFAFLATYAARMGKTAAAEHLPLGHALREYAAAADRDRLLALLKPLQIAGERVPWLKRLVERREIYHPIRFTAGDAWKLLQSVPELEAAGLVVRAPREWRSGRPARVKAQATVGPRATGALTAGELLSFDVATILDGERLTAREVEELLAATDGLAFLRGRWVEVDAARLSASLDRFHRIAAEAGADGVPFPQAMRLLAGADLDGASTPDPDWGTIVAGGALAETLRALRAPGEDDDAPPPDLRATLRPYQRVGLSWLRLLARLGLGACLADDMGLGKTIQVIALLLRLRREEPSPVRPSLLVAPASLLANWAGELERFAPTLRTRILHPSAMARTGMDAPPGDLAELDLLLTTYGTVRRLDWLPGTDFRLVILDEAQAIKNPSAAQTKAVKRLTARARIALTGTPVENRLADLWSLFDFLNPGLLGGAKRFSAWAKRLADRPAVNRYAPLRDLVRPYLLRRLKSDPAVIADLPEKTEMLAWCALSRRQASLYAEGVRDLADALAKVDGIARKGAVLSAILRFKQICNHPSQWLGDAAWSPVESGKFARLSEIAETVFARREKMLVFTQFRETTAPLAAFLGGLAGRDGLVLHGGTPVARRKDLVARFQEDDAIPFFVLSLKAGGAGLNLTAASHVVHFDRWWNPAVENQATDRAFRIGQRRNVIVHKLVCAGTVEEKIDRLIETKKRLAGDLVEGGAEALLTEMSDEELLKFVALDLSSVEAEE